MAKTVEIKVVKTFRDKEDHVTIYDPGKVLNLPAKRCADLVKRGLAEYVKPEPPPSDDDKKPKADKANDGKTKGDEPKSGETKGNE